MAAGDITLLRDGSFGNCGSRLHNVALSATTIKAGEPVEKVRGSPSVIPATNNFPLLSGTPDAMVGIATTTSTNTGSAAGSVQILSLVPGQVFLIKPKVALATDQATYDALVGLRVLIDLTGGSYTLLVADNADNGCVIEPLDVAKYPAKVAFSVREAANYLA